tara:strand:+ start:9063 stop:10982 length:1920 start_codon:yes stop_codon:yes gene_type:complete
MWDQPRLEYKVFNSDSILDQLETLVPGCLVYLRVSRGTRSWKIRLAKLDPASPDLEGCASQYYEVFAPIHGAWLVEGYLQQAGVYYEGEAHDTEYIKAWDPAERERLITRGAGLLRSLIEVRDFVGDILTDYQKMNIAWADTRPWVMNVWACGAGKTLGSLLSALTRPGPIMVICPAKARHVWWSQVQEYTTIKPFRVKPSSNVRKKDQLLEDYLKDCRTQGNRALVIIGAESIADNMAIVDQVDPCVLVFDELHTHGSQKRWVAIQEADGSVSFEKRKTTASGKQSSKVDRVNRAVAIMEVSRRSSVALRIGLTATPLDDGRPRRLWSQLDLLTPGGFAHSYRRFAERYCDARPGDFGGLDDTGSSNMAELRARCSFFTHEVPYSESHSQLPSTRVQVVYLPTEQLNRAERFSDKQTFGQAIKSLHKTATNPLERERVIEARLSEACSRKRRYVADEVLEGLKGGGKVVVFTARRRETELWAHQIRKGLKRGDEALGEVPVWMGHGGVSEAERDDMVDAFRGSEGPCVLVGTGQAFGTAVDGMQTTDLAIFAMLPWKPGDFTQWKGRFDRLGGRATLLKVVVASGTYDERVVDILVEKFGPIEQFLKAEELKGLDQKLLGLEDKEAIVNSIISKLGAA